MAKHYTYLIAALVGLWVCLAIYPATAQESACPEGSTGAFVGGGYPDDLEACILIQGSGMSGFLTVKSDITDVYPCTQQLYLDYNMFILDTGMNSDDYSFYFAWPDDKISNEARVRLYFWLPQIVGTIAPPAPVQGNWYVRYFWPTGTPVSGVNGVISSLPSYSLRVEDNLGLTRYTNLYFIDVTLPTTFVPSGTASGGFFQFTLQRTIGEPFPYDIMVASPQIDLADAVYPSMCSIDGYQISTATPTPTGVWSTPTPGVPGPTVPANPTPTLRPWPTNTVRPYVTLIPEPSATPYPLPTLQQIVWPTLAPINTQPPIQLTVEAIETTRESYYMSMTLGLEELSESWTVPLEESWNVLEITGTQSISSTTETVAEFTQYISFPIALFKSLIHYTPTTWPIWALLIAAVAWELLVEMIKVAIAVVATLAEYVRRLWESIPLN